MPVLADRGLMLPSKPEQPANKLPSCRGCYPTHRRSGAMFTSRSVGRIATVRDHQHFLRAKLPRLGASSFAHDVAHTEGNRTRHRRRLRGRTLRRLAVVSHAGRQHIARCRGRRGPDAIRRYRRAAYRDAGRSGVDAGTVTDLFDRIRRRAFGNSLLVVRRERLVMARSFNAGATTRSTIQSVTRSVTSPAAGLAVDRGLIGERYLETIAIPLGRGRSLDANDRQGSPPAIISNEMMAKLFWRARPAGRQENGAVGIGGAV